MRRGLKRHQPNRGDAEAVEIVQAPCQSTEVADAVTVGVHVGADRQAIDDGILVPKVADHAGRPVLVDCPTITPSSACRTKGTDIFLGWTLVERSTWLPAAQAGSQSSLGSLLKLSATSNRWPLSTRS